MEHQRGQQLYMGMCQKINLNLGSFHCFRLNHPPPKTLKKQQRTYTSFATVHSLSSSGYYAVYFVIVVIASRPSKDQE